jgi:RNA polymerase sigma-70 factor, ECF subfamily
MSTQVTDITDSLVVAAQAGDASSFHVLFAPHEKKMYRFALRILRNEADAEDVVQDALHKAYSHLNAFRGDRVSFGTWLSRIVYHESIMAIRRRKHAGVSYEEAFAAEPGQAPNLPASKEVPVDQAMIKDERHQILMRCLDRMQPIYRDLLMLHLGMELTHEQIAHKMAIPLNTVKVRIFRAKQMLKTRMDGYLNRQPRFQTPSDNPLAA